MKLKFRMERLERNGETTWDFTN